MPSSAPSTTPRTSERRSPVVPSESASSTPCAAGRRRHRSHPAARRAARSRSRGGRRAPPAARASLARRIRSRALAGRPGAPGARGSPPCGGARPTGSSSSTRSRISTPSKRRTSAMTRIANGVVLAAPVTTTRAAAGSPIRPARTLRSSSCSLTAPHQSPSATSAPAPRASRKGVGRLSSATAAPGTLRRHPPRGGTRASSRRRGQARARRA